MKLFIKVRSFFINSLLFIILFSCSFSDKTENTASQFPYTGYQPVDLVSGISPHETAHKKPVVRFIGLARPEIIQLTIDAREVKIDPVKKYQPQAADSIALTANAKKVPLRFAEYMNMNQYIDSSVAKKGKFSAYRYIYRNGKALGWLAGKKQDKYWPVNQIIGERLQTQNIKNQENYRLSYISENGQKTWLVPTAIHRKSKPHVRARFGPVWEADYGEKHQLFLVFPENLKPGINYSLSIENLNIENKNIEFVFEPKQLRSEAILVNQAGYQPDQPSKTAFLSQWMGDGGATRFDELKKFHLVNAQTNEICFSGDIKLLNSSSDTEFVSQRFGPDNYNGTSVYAMDFSAFSDTGQYKIFIENLGCSFSFPIKNKVWEQNLLVQMKGIFHQRSGIAIGQPLSAYSRPLNHHPDAGFSFFVCDRNKFYNDSLYSAVERAEWNPFSRIMHSLNFDSVNNNAWGGWMDAADYDRRNQHFRAVHKMLALFSVNPRYFEQLSLNIPESGNQIPDIIDEALWCTELWRRTQAADGAVIFGIETVMHPLPGESSFMESLPYALMPGNSVDAYLYAGVAANMAQTLKPYDNELAEKYHKSALAAWNWGKENENKYPYRMAPHLLNFSKNNAALHLWQITDDAEFQSQIQNYISKLSSKKSISEYDIYFLTYAALNQDFKNNPQHSETKKLIIAHADSALKTAEKIAYGEFGWFDTNPWLNIQLGSELVVAAHKLTGQSKYLNALIKAANYGLGMNPQNTVFTSGIGTRHIIPWDDEAEYQGIEPSVGIPAFGPHLIERNGNVPEKAFLWCKKRIASIDQYVYPHFMQWPVRETYFELVKLANINEFTIHQNMSDQMFRWGYLSQYFSQEHQNQ